MTSNASPNLGANSQNLCLPFAEGNQDLIDTKTDGTKNPNPETYGFSSFVHVARGKDSPVMGMDM